MFNLAITLTLLGGAFTAPTPGRTFTLLKDERSKITFAPYTPEQRQEVAKSLNALMSIFVHRENKIEFYGKDFPNLDAIPRVQELSTRVANMTDKDMHYEYVKIFQSQRDLHTNYLMPAPHRCYAFVTAASFTFAQNKNWLGIQRDQPKVVVRGLSVSDEVLALSPDSAKINVGDELLTIDGITFEEYYKKTQFDFSGANEWGGKRASMNALGARGGSLNPPPQADSVTYELKSFNTGKKYTVTLPWIARSTDTCQAEYSRFLQTLQTSSFSESEYEPMKYSEKEIQKNLYQDKNIQLDEFQEVFGKRSGGEDKLVLNPTSDPIISWGIWKKDSKNLGVIVMTAFTPVLDTRPTVKLIRDLLTNQLKDTNALVWDLRSNGGGSVPFADALPQLFGFEVKPGVEPAIVPGLRRAIAAPANEFIFLNSTPVTDPWHQAYLQVKPGDKFMPLTRITPIENANFWGLAYLKPVGVFHNGNCYSACDLFSASMKDNVGATIFGEDGTSGAGGANVVALNTFLTTRNPRDFKQMPFNNPQQLPTAAQDARVAWRQSLRVKEKLNQLIEDNGVPTEVRILPSELDLIPNTNQNSQLDRIADSLNQKALTSGRRFMYFQTTPNFEAQVSLGSAVEFQLDVQGLRRIQVLDGSNKEVASLQVPITQLLSRQQRSIRFAPTTTKPAIERYEIKAFDAFGKQVLTTYRFITFVLNPTDFAAVPATPLTLDASARYAVVTERGASQEGWKAQGTKLVIPADYQNDIDSTVSFFMKASPKPVNVVISGTYSVETDFDYISLGFRDTTNVSKELFKLTGDGVLNNRNFTFTPQGDFQVELKFTADGGVSAKGVTIDSIQISA